MIGIVIVGHSNISKEFLIALEHIVGKQENILAISIFPNDDINKKREEIIKSVKNVNKGKGVVILTDMFGSTPSNIAKEFCNKKNVNVVSGINLSMLLNIFNYPKLNLKEITNKAVEGGKDGVIQINYERKKNNYK